MAFAISHVNAVGAARALNQMHACAASVGDSLCAIATKVRDLVASPVGQGVIGLGLGLGMHQIYEPLTETVVALLGSATILPDPMMGMGLSWKILLTPLVCVVGPIAEEILFRGGLVEALKETLNEFYVNQGFSDANATLASCVTALFFSSVIFGLVHFTNALVFWCNPVLFLPQVVAATCSGFLLGLAKEFSGGLSMPIGMHIGNNTFAWAVEYIGPSL